MLPRIQGLRGSAQTPGGSTFALLAPLRAVSLFEQEALLAAPCGPSAMRFLRPARGFGWLDPRLNSSATKPLKWFLSRASGLTAVGFVRRRDIHTAILARQRILNIAFFRRLNHTYPPEQEMLHQGF